MTAREHWHCPKCLSSSGDSWGHCEGKCPIAQSPHYDERVAAIWDFPVPYATPGAVVE